MMYSLMLIVPYDSADSHGLSGALSLSPFTDLVHLPTLLESYSTQRNNQLWRSGCLPAQHVA
nr:hypothetical protein Q903MT_gene6519 [Picea sitchensis]